VLERESGELRVQRLPAGSEAAVAFASALPGPVRATYEAGPTGFLLARRLEAAGIDCVVCAPGLIPRGATDRVKTDRRDAERLVRLLVAGELHRVVVPTVEEEALRDLVRAREDLRGDLMRPVTGWPSCCRATRCASTGRRLTGPKRTSGGWPGCVSGSRRRSARLRTIAAPCTR
jgi:transposase